MPEQSVNPWELTVRIVPISDLKEMENNARTHSPRSIEAIKDSLERNELRKPVVVASDGVTVIAGNGTLVAARQLGWTHLSVADSPFEAGSKEARAYALQDNRTQELSMFDRDILEDTLRDLDDGALGLGWDTDELSALLPPPSPNAGAAAHFGQLSETTHTIIPDGGSEGSPSSPGGVGLTTNPVVNPSEGYATLILTGTQEEVAKMRAKLNILKSQWGLAQLGETALRLLNEYDAGPGATGSASA